MKRTCGSSARSSGGFEPVARGRGASEHHIGREGRRSEERELTAISDDVGRVAVPYKAVCVVQHARTAANVAEDDERDRLGRERRARGADPAKEHEERQAAGQSGQETLEDEHGRARSGPWCGGRTRRGQLAVISSTLGLSLPHTDRTALLARSTVQHRSSTRQQLSSHRPSPPFKL